MKTSLAFLLFASWGLFLGATLWLLVFALCAVMALWLVIGGIADDIKLLTAKASRAFFWRTVQPRG